MIYQLHWQDGNPASPTYLAHEFVAQSAEVVDQDSMDRTYERFQQIVKERRAECPADWLPMICDEGAKEFARATEETGS